MGYLSGSKYSQGNVQAPQRRVSYSEEFEELSTLETLLLFHGLSFVKYLVRKSGLRALRNATAHTGIKMGILNQLILKALSTFRRVVRLPQLSKGIVTYLIIGRRLVQLYFLSVNGFAFITQTKSL